MGSKPNYTEWEDDYMRQMANVKTVKEIAKDLNRSYDAVRVRMHKLNIEIFDMSRYYNDLTIKICLNCKRKKCTPTCCENPVYWGGNATKERKKKHGICENKT